jgi:hypothetical protein
MNCNLCRKKVEGTSMPPGWNTRIIPIVQKDTGEEVCTLNYKALCPDCVKKIDELLDNDAKRFLIFLNKKIREFEKEEERKKEETRPIEPIEPRKSSAPYSKPQPKKQFNNKGRKWRRKNWKRNPNKPQGGIPNV